jgi:gliding motility-associated-like protein
LEWNADSTLNDTTIVNPIASPTSTTTYFVDILFSVPACIVSDSVVVTVNPCSLENITNVFTPDGDGVNDTWIIEGINAYPDNTVVVFNRWGSRLIELKGYDNATVVWDGKYNGTKVASGTYYFVIELHGEGQQRSGWVQVNY